MALHQNKLKEKITIGHYTRPCLYFSVVLIITFVFELMSAYISRMEPITKHRLLPQSIFLFMGMLTPMTMAFIMILPNKSSRKDFVNRIINFKKIKPIYFIISCLIMPASILLAQAISLFFGYSISQFTFKSTIFSVGVFSGWTTILIAPFIEEFGWHSYGVDSLRNQFNLFTTSIIFGIVWFSWHLPLFFIKGYYNSHLLEMGFIYNINFFAEIIIFSLIINYLYYKSSRVIMIPIILHLTVDIFSELFNTHPDSKVIQTMILFIVAVVIVLKDKDFFFRLDYRGE